MNVQFPELQVSQRYRAGKAGMVRILADVAASKLCRYTVYLTPEFLASPEAVSSRGLKARTGDASLSAIIADTVRQMGESETGIVLFLWDDHAVAVVPPFPVAEDVFSEGADTADLLELLDQDLLVGVILLRLGRYAVGVIQDDELLASKSDTRYVKNRHHKGGSSQRRFERSRERLVRELFDATCEVAKNIFTPFADRIDYLLLGGERHTLEAFERRCDYLKGLPAVRLRRRLQVERPGRKALEKIHHEIWKSLVLVFTRADGT